jgi:hypothetical protein
METAFWLLKVCREIWNRLLHNDVLSYIYVAFDGGIRY